LLSIRFYIFFFDSFQALARILKIEDLVRDGENNAAVPKATVAFERISTVGNLA
jgi:hypothetical protein